MSLFSTMNQNSSCVGPTVAFSERDRTIRIGIFHFTYPGMPLTRYERQWCLNLLDKLASLELTQTIFNNAEFRSEASLRVKTPMTIDIIRQNLSKYESVSDFGKDVDLIWFNVKSCFEADSPLYLIALQLEQWFSKRFQRIPKTSMDEWMMQFQKLQRSVGKLLDQAPARR
jgi:hypothetical protein